MTNSNHTKTTKIAVVSLGCPKNQCDAELMLAKIAAAGYALTQEPGLADVVIINTCGFIQSAKEEAIEEILEAAARKKDGINKKIIVTGCLAERYKEKLADEFPEADAFLGLADNNGIVTAIEEVLQDKRVLKFGGLSGHCMEGERLLSTLPHYAYLRIADGCDNRCAYCAIPLFRGGYRARPMESILEEARSLAQSGVREVILVAQDVTNYQHNGDGLPKLLKALTEIDTLKWIRLLYCYPQRITDELIEVIRDEPKIVKYLDIPIQHCNDEILNKMNRRGTCAGGLGNVKDGQEVNTHEGLRRLIAKLRGAIPDLVLRTTVLVGFPSETEEQFTELAEFVHDPETRFEHLGCFAYSEEEGTAAAEFPDQVPEEERERRREIITEQQDIRAAEWLGGLIGREVEAVTEGFDKYAGLYFGRCYFQAPEIDSMVYFSVSPEVKEKIKPEIGQFVNIKLTETVDNNLIGLMRE